MMIRWYRIAKMCCAGISLILIGIYVLIWEPYCFFTTTLHSNDASSLSRTKIYTARSTSTRSHQRNLIAILSSTVATKLSSRLKLIDQRFHDNFTTPVLIMHTTGINEAKARHLSANIKRPVYFLNVADAFRLFPVGFDPCRTKTSYRVRGKWNYLLMIRFWFKLIFELPQLQEYDYVMRLDDDSRLTGSWFNVFDEMRAKNAIYFANNMDVDCEKQLPGTMLLKQITDQYIQQNKIEVKQPDMLRNAFSNDTVRNYYNNFEVVKVEFFKREDVRRWVEAIDATQGIFKYRWGDAVLRYLTMAIFAEKQAVLHRPNYNLSYCHKC